MTEKLDEKNERMLLRGERFEFVVSRQRRPDGKWEVLFEFYTPPAHKVALRDMGRTYGRIVFPTDGTPVDFLGEFKLVAEMLLTEFQRTGGRP